MDTQGNGLTLEALAHKLETLQRENAERLETLERENERMRSENAELRGEVTALRGSETRRGEVAEIRDSETRRSGQPVSVLEGLVSRRSLLSKAGAAAVAAVAAGTLLNTREAKAHPGDDPIHPEYVFTDWVFAQPHDDKPAIRGIAASATWGGVTGENVGSGPGVWGNSKTGAAVKGEASGNGGIGVKGISTGFNPGPGVRGDGVIGVWGSSATKGQAGVYGAHDGLGPGVVGDGTGGYAGVWGRSGSGNGVQGESRAQQGNLSGVRGMATDDGNGVRGTGGTGVWGSSSRTGYSGVYGQHTGSSGYGLVGDGTGGSAGVLGRNPSGTAGLGVKGTGSYIGVWGESNQAGTSGIYGRNDNGIGVRGAGATGIRGETLSRGHGVIGQGKGSSFAGVQGRNQDGAGVWGQSSATGYEGVYGQHTGTAGYGIVGDGTGSSGAGVLGRNGSGYGGQFEGGKAQLMLKPAGSAGKPSGAHSKGEVYMDSKGALFVCVVGGNPAKWRKLSTTAV